MASRYLTEPFDAVFAVKGLAPKHPVFALVLADDSGVVIKQDSPNKQGGAEGLKHNLSIMKTVSPQAAGKMLVPSEVQAIKDYVVRSKQYITKLKQQPDKDLEELEHYIGQYQNWYKMAEAPGLIDLATALSQARAATNASKRGIRDIAQALNAPGGFETLGRIVAADLYNVNSDRFYLNENFGSRDGAHDETLGQRYRVLQNIGNVMVTVQKKDRIVLGLDSYDPTSDYHDIHQQIDAADAGWWGSLLSTAKRPRLGNFCQDIFLDLEEALGPRNRKFSFLNQKRLDPRGAQRIYDGTQQGRAMIIEKVIKLAGKMAAGTNSGLQSRLLIIQS